MRSRPRSTACGGRTARLDSFEAAIDSLRRERQKQATAAPAAVGAEPAKLPARFADRIDYQNKRADPHCRDLGYSAQFDMVLVPGDPAKGIGPFYVETTEVTWQMFRAWSYCEDLLDPGYASSQKQALLRPSPCYDDASRGHGFDGRAALGVSRRNALAFCRFVSEQTGRSYRLWTEAEWRYIAEATGGVPQQPLAVAWLRENAECDDFGEPRSMPVGKKPADSLGLYDFWGNVAEWVMDDKQYIRGGSYLTSASELTLDWREDESQAIWNMTYPNFPKSLWWYRDRFDMGFRLVCDPVDIPMGK
jgi:formylglycine-generating enzyme required for sulfatase activity